jgi:hypothetical protein
VNVPSPMRVGTLLSFVTPSLPSLLTLLD